jgi:hypothetical protein
VPLADRPTERLPGLTSLRAEPSTAPPSDQLGTLSLEGFTPLRIT